MIVCVDLLEKRSKEDDLRRLNAEMEGRQRAEENSTRLASELAAVQVFEPVSILVRDHPVVGSVWFFSVQFSIQSNCLISHQAAAIKLEAEMRAKAQRGQAEMRVKHEAGGCLLNA